MFNRSNRKVKGKRITTFIKAFTAACTKAGCPGRIPHGPAADRRAQPGARRRSRARRHADDRAQDALGFERYNIVSECDLLEAAKKLNTLQPVPPASDRDWLAATKPRSGEVGHNSGTVEPDRGPRLRSQSLDFFGKFGGAARNRTGDGGFADLCLTAWRRRPSREGSDVTADVRPN